MKPFILEDCREIRENKSFSFNSREVMVDDNMRPGMGDFHAHTHYEISYIAKGPVTVLTKDNAYDNVEACVALFGPLTMHCVIPAFNTVYKRINVSFSENFVATMPEDWSALSAMFSVQGSVLMLSQEQCRQVETILSLLEKEAKPQNQRLLLMYYLVVLQDVDVKDENRTQLPPYVAGAIQYMHEHYAEKVTAEMLAEWLDVGRTTLLMSFHRIMGVTVHQYLVNLRMKRVKELHEQGMPLAEAAEKCGFCDLGGYIRAYRRLFGTTPKGKGKK